ncbi:Protein transport protein sec22 like [Verticillium longisporum]|nr:Protein transport protein sec22 like [Verticillium longisporum]
MKSIRSTQIARLDGLMLCASVDDEHQEGDLNDELRDVTKVMTKNIEDLLYRGDSLERMGELSSRLRDDSKKYKRAAVRINWELLLKQYGPIGGLGLFIIIFLWWRFF